MSAELEIPQAARDAAIRLLAEPRDWREMWAHLDDVIRAIAAPVVAGELSGFADAYAATIPGDYRDWTDVDMALNGVVNELRARVDDLLGDES